MSTSRSIAWSVWLIASIFYAYQYILRVMPNIMLKDIHQQFHMDSAVFGQFSGFYYIGYSLMHLPMGILLDRWGPRNVLSVCILLTVIGMCPLILDIHYIYPIIGRFLIGIGSSAAILGTFKIIRMTFAEQKFTRMLSFSVTIGLLGALYGGGPLSYLCITLGYKIVIQIFLVIGMILALLTYIIVPPLKNTSQSSVVTDIKDVLKHRRVISLCICAGLMVGPLEGFADVWGSEFLKCVYGFKSENANYLPSLIFVGMCFGASLLSFIAEKTGNFLGCILGAGTVMLIGFLGLLSKQLTSDSMIGMFIIVGACCAYQILAIYKAFTYVPEHLASLTTALANMIIMSFGYAFHSIIGIVIKTYDNLGQGQAFIYGISIIPFALGLGIVGFTFLYLQEQKENKKI